MRQQFLLPACRARPVHFQQAPTNIVDLIGSRPRTQQAVEDVPCCEKHAREHRRTPGEEPSNDHYPLMPRERNGWFRFRPSVRPVANSTATNPTVPPAGFAMAAREGSAMASSMARSRIQKPAARN